MAGYDLDTKGLGMSGLFGVGAVMISCSHWGLFRLDPRLFEVDGPVYADRVGGRLTFFDWKTWTADDQELYRDRYKRTIASWN